MRQKGRKIKLIILLSIVLLLLLISTNVLVSYFYTKKTVEVTMAHNAIEIAKKTAENLDVDSYEYFLADRTESEDYWKIRRYLNDVREKTRALYVYTLDLDGTDIAKVLIASFPDDGIHHYDIGMACTLPRKQVKLAYQGDTYYTSVINDPDYGKYISVGAPIKNGKKSIIGYLAIDISVENLKMINSIVVRNHFFVFIFNALFVLFMVAVFYVMQKWYQKELKTEVGATEKVYQSELNSLYNSARSIRHDYANHVQILHGLLKLKKGDEALEYLNSLRSEMQELTPIPIETNNPALLVLLQTKMIQAQNNKIEVNLDISKDTFDKIKTIDLIKILSNLFDNAIDATTKLPEQERRIDITCKIETSYCLIEVKNSGPTIPNTEKLKIFNAGYTSKKLETDKVQGQGLFIVQQVVDKYKGSIELDSENGVTSFQVMIPIK